MGAMHMMHTFYNTNESFNKNQARKTGFRSAGCFR
jgi:hypothetical protein